MTTDKTVELKSRLALGVVDYLTRAADHPFATLVSIDQQGDEDILNIEIEPELSQVRAVPIIDREPIRIVFSHDDDRAPRVYSSRTDFPYDLTHTNHDPGPHGLNLCVWEEKWNDLARALSAQALVERIRGWFAQSGSGALHTADQPLEPLLPALSHTLALPPGERKGPWFVVGGSEINGRWTLVLANQPSAIDDGLPKFSVFSLALPPQVHGSLRERPYDLAALVSLVSDFGTDLLSELSAWLVENDQRKQASNRQPLIFITVPLRRTADGPIETIEAWAYTPAETLAEFGAVIGCTITDHATGAPVTVQAVPALPAGDLAAIKLQGWRVVQRLNRAAARKYAATGRAEDAKLVAIGAGAIGSNLITNTVKAGIGTWTIIDDDVVLPHNTVRQTQGDKAVGYSKSMALRVEVDQLIADTGMTDIQANVIYPGEHAAAISLAVEGADWVFDLSASPAVLGYVCDQPVQRAASLFFNPEGSDLVALFEDAERHLRLDEIEAQYFLAAATEPTLEGHLAAARVDRIRYANACQDLTRPLPPWQVQTLCGVAAGHLIRQLDHEGTSARVWRLEPSTGGISPMEIALSPVGRIESSGTKITIAHDVIAAMRLFRKKSAPNETGGILLGSFDIVRNVVHIVAALPAPEDSRQSPTYFVRGSAHLKPLVDHIARGSAGQIGYLGEWHSHPDGVAARPSADDEQVFSYLQSHIGPTGAPFSMVICGKDETWLRTGWQGRNNLEDALPHG